MGDDDLPPIGDFSIDMNAVVGMASMIRAMYVALIGEGFTSTEALTFCVQYLVAMSKG